VPRSAGRGKGKDKAASLERGTSGGKGDRDISRTDCYTVRKGDTIYGIARRFGVAPDVIIDVNKLKNSKIIPGTKLRIPVPDGKRNSPILKYKNTKTEKNSPDFRWPLKTVKGCTKDGDASVKSIGIIIKGTPKADVFASEKGTIKKIGYMRGYGKYIIISHENRFVTVYSNMEDIRVKEGDSVKKGDFLGRVSNDSTLHFQIGKAGKAENPLNYLPARS